MKAWFSGERGVLDMKSRPKRRGIKAVRQFRAQARPNGIAVEAHRQTHKIHVQFTNLRYVPRLRRRLLKALAEASLHPKADKALVSDRQPSLNIINKLF